MQRVKIIYGANYVALEKRINTFLKDLAVPVISIQTEQGEDENGNKFWISVILYAD